MATLSKILIENCTFEDLLCYSNGGALNFYNNKQIKLYYSNFYNTTSTKLVNNLNNLFNSIINN